MKLTGWTLLLDLGWYLWLYWAQKSQIPRVRLSDFYSQFLSATTWLWVVSNPKLINQLFLLNCTNYSYWQYKLLYSKFKQIIYLILVGNSSFFWCSIDCHGQVTGGTSLTLYHLHWCKWHTLWPQGSIEIIEKFRKYSQAHLPFSPTLEESESLLVIEHPLLLHPSRQASLEPAPLAFLRITSIRSDHPQYDLLPFCFWTWRRMPSPCGSSNTSCDTR